MANNYNNNNGGKKSFSKPAAMPTRINKPIFSHDKMCGFNSSNYAGILQINFWNTGKSSTPADRFLMSADNLQTFRSYINKVVEGREAAILAKLPYPVLEPVEFQAFAMPGGVLNAYGALILASTDVDGIQRVTLSHRPVDGGDGTPCTVILNNGFAAHNTHAESIETLAEVGIDPFDATLKTVKSIVNGHDSSIWTLAAFDSAKGAKGGNGGGNNYRNGNGGGSNNNGGGNQRYSDNGNNSSDFNISDQDDGEY